MLLWEYYVYCTAAESLQPYLDALAFLRTAFYHRCADKCQENQHQHAGNGSCKENAQASPDMINAFRILDSSSLASTKDKEPWDSRS